MTYILCGIFILFIVHSVRLIVEVYGDKNP
jgi:hypothetical protein